ncbi:MAG: transcription antitermination factor NusB [Chitinophagales bacterium]|nr:transcription antitermination factor NusB [Chitinophagales bacterium]MDW8427905.1 transcription antitermination factor NusB [Chitinophagales bacterium]
MISRHLARIKVMQVLYAHIQDQEKTLNRLERYLLENINKTYKSFLYSLYVLCKTAEYVYTDIRIRAEKFFPSAQDQINSVAIFENTVIQHFIRKEKLYDVVEAEKLNRLADPDLFRLFFQLLRKTPQYVAFAQKANPLLTDEREIVIFLYRAILSTHDLYQQHMEDLFSSWPDDRELIFSVITTHLNNIGPDDPPHIVREAQNQREVKQFALKLLRAVKEHEAETQALILPFLENWDPERVALLDMLLMKMTLTEWLYFPEIPVKVSFDEYIEISKRYSTPKSGEFINGVLDAVLRKLRAEQLVQKAGRGALEA